MSERCPKCGSTKVEAINGETVFVRGKAEPVYALANHKVCLDCGFAECSLAPKTLAKLRDLLKT
jgi:ribosomal protein L32